jgi:sugar (pentulose or hexulose) kinase
MADFFLGIDAGGTAVKVAVIAADGRECGVAATTFRAAHPAPGHSERDPEAMWLALCDNTRRAMAMAKIGADDIAAIGVTGYGNGFYLIDDAGRPTTPGILAPIFAPPASSASGSATVAMRRNWRGLGSMPGPASQARCSPGSSAISRRSCRPPRPC